MPVQRKYNVWKTGIILTIKKWENVFRHVGSVPIIVGCEETWPWLVVAISKTNWEKNKIVLPIKIFGRYLTYKEACEAIPEIQKTIDKYKFPR